jgi:NAD(P)-dependent dehydrogenase (short-subunit alcohol dehydrogenase family)
MTKNILITGSAKRIGQHLALSLAQSGHNIIIHYHNSETDAITTKEKIQSFGGSAWLVKQDLMQENAAENLFEISLKHAGTIDAIINSASIFEPDTLEHFSQSLWDNHHKIHVHVPLKLTQLLLESTQNNHQSSVINILDQRVKRPTPLFFSYTASKMAMASLTIQCAISCAPKVRVNGISPGATLPSTRQTQENFNLQCKTTPLSITVFPDDIARAALFLIQTPSITGEIITIDSGQNLDWRTNGFLHCIE